MMEQNLSQHYLYPSALFASKTPHQVTTVLGSCISVCFWDPILKIGGISHFMLPLWNGEGLASPKFGNIAIEKLLAKMISLGSIKSHLQAKVFGGGVIIETAIQQFNIGERNITIALQMLDELKIPIVSKSVGGTLGRKIIFYTESGQIMHKFIEKRSLNFDK